MVSLLCSLTATKYLFTTAAAGCQPGHIRAAGRRLAGRLPAAGHARRRRPALLQAPQRPRQRAHTRCEQAALWILLLLLLLPPVPTAARRRRGGWTS